MQNAHQIFWYVLPCVCLSFSTRAVACYDTVCKAGYSVVRKLGQMHPLVVRLKEDPVGRVQPNSGRLLHAKIKVFPACFKHMRRYERDDLQIQTSLLSY
jgi:hypothetical protein